MTIEDLDSLFVSENGFSKFLPMITENSCLRITSIFTGSSYHSISLYCDVNTKNTNGSLLNKFQNVSTAGFVNQKLTMLSFMVTDENIERIISLYNIVKPKSIIVGDVVVVEIFLVFNQHILKQFQVKFPNNFVKKYYSVQSSLDTYQSIILDVFESNCQKIISGTNLKKTLVNFEISFCDWKMELPVTVSVYVNELPISPTIKFFNGDFHFFVNRESKGNLTNFVDITTLQTMKSLGLKTTPKFRKQSVQRRMTKYYMDEK
jgi:hypothetical protein